MVLPEQTTLGNLEYLEIYEYYDAPLLFSALSDTGVIYLAMWFEELRYGQEFLYMTISEARLGELKRKELDVFSAFRNPEKEIYRVRALSMYRPDESVTICVDEIKNDLYSEEDVYIEYISKPDEFFIYCELP